MGKFSLTTKILSIITGISFLVSNPSGSYQSVKSDNLKISNSSIKTLASGESKQGFVFINGKYISPPYKLEVISGNVFLNNRLIRPLSKPSKFNLKQEKKETEIKAAFLKQEYVLQEKTAIAWQTLLDSGGVLLIVNGGSAEIAPRNTSRFLRELVAVFQSSESQRFELMNQLTGSQGNAQAFLAVGEPAPNFYARMPKQLLQVSKRKLSWKLPIQITQSLQLPFRLSSPAIAHTTGNSHHGDYDTPSSRDFRVFNLYPSDTNSRFADISPLRQAAQLHHYDFYEYRAGGEATVSNFYRHGPEAGVLYVHSHGANYMLCVEEYETKEERNRVYEAYKRNGTYPVYQGGGDEQWTRSDLARNSLNPTICATDSGIRRRWSDRNGGIVILFACGTFPLYDDFSQREFIAPGQTCTEDNASLINPDFWGYLDGTLENGRNRTVGDAFPLSYPPQSRVNAARYTDNFQRRSVPGYPYFQLATTVEGNTVLSPAVISVSPFRSQVHIGQRVNVRVDFDVPVGSPSPSNQDMISIATNRSAGITLTGSCQPQILEPVSFSDGGRTLTFAFEPKSTGAVYIELDSESIVSRNNGAFLDGNQNPPGGLVDHVGPNRDNFRWDLTCYPPEETSTSRLDSSEKSPLTRGTNNVSDKLERLNEVRVSLSNQIEQLQEQLEHTTDPSVREEVTPEQETATSFEQLPANQRERVINTFPEPNSTINNSNSNQLNTAIDEPTPTEPNQPASITDSERQAISITVPQTTSPQTDNLEQKPLISAFCQTKIDNYRHKLVELLNGSWEPVKPPHKGIWEVVLFYDVTAQRTVENMTLYKSSGYQPLDESARQHVNNLSQQFNVLGTFPECVEEIPVEHHLRLKYW